MARKSKQYMVLEGLKTGINTVNFNIEASQDNMKLPYYLTLLHYVVFEIDINKLKRDMFLHMYVAALFTMIRI